MTGGAAANRIHSLASLARSMRRAGVLLARVRVLAAPVAPLRRNLAVASSLLLFVGGVYGYTVFKMANTELVDVAKELEAYRVPTAAGPTLK